MTYMESLLSQFREKQSDLARTDFDLEYVGQKYARAKKGTLEAFSFLEMLNGLQKKRQIVTSKLAELRIEIEKEKRKNGDNFIL